MCRFLYPSMLRHSDLVIKLFDALQLRLLPPSLCRARQQGVLRKPNFNPSSTPTASCGSQTTPAAKTTKVSCFVCYTRSAASTTAVLSAALLLGAAWHPWCSWSAWNDAATAVSHCRMFPQCSRLGCMCVVCREQYMMTMALVMEQQYPAKAPTIRCCCSLWMPCQ